MMIIGLAMMLWNVFLAIWVIYVLAKYDEVKDFKCPSDGKVDAIYTLVLVYCIMGCLAGTGMPILKKFVKPDEGGKMDTYLGVLGCLLGLGAFIPACMIANITFNIPEICKLALTTSVNNFWLAMNFITWTMIGAFIICFVSCCMACCVFATMKDDLENMGAAAAAAQAAGSA